VIGKAAPENSKRPILFSITHKFSSHDEAQLDIGQPRQASPKDSIAGRRIARARKISSKSREPDQITRNRFYLWTLRSSIFRQLIEQMDFQRGGLLQVFQPPNALLLLNRHSCRIDFFLSALQPVNLVLVQNFMAVRPRGSPLVVIARLECLRMPHTR